MAEPTTAAFAVALAYENLQAVSKAWALAAASGEAWEDEGLFVVSSGAPMRSFNGAFLTRKPDASTLTKVAAYFRKRGVPFRARSREQDAADESTLAAAGFEASFGLPCLVLGDLAVDAPPTPLDIQRVLDARTLRDHVEVVAAAFDWSHDALGQAFPERLLAEPYWRGYVGYADGQPVASSQLFVHRGVAGIYYVGTLDSYRKCGFGEAMTAHAVSEGAAAGCWLASLQASPMGLPIYERMGFRQVDYYCSFVLKET